MIDLLDALRYLLSDGTDLATDDTCERPYEWKPDTLYVWEESSNHEPFESGPVVRENFVIVAAIAERTNEEARGERSRETTEALYGHRDRMLDLIRLNRSVGLWEDGHLRAESVPGYLRQLEIRGIALRITGYRLVS